MHMTMTRRLTPLLLALFLTAVSPAKGADNCAGTQGEMNHCAARQFEGEQNAMNTALQSALARAYDAEAETLLRKSQEAWLAYRDAQCAYNEDQFRGGSIAPLVDFMCRTQLTQARTLELAAYDPGTTPLARMLMEAGDRLPDTIFWNPATTLYEDIDADGIFDTSFLGLQPGELPDIITAYLAVLVGGSNKVAIATIPVDGNSGLCAPSIALSAEFPEGEQPMLVIDDGACDAFRFRLLKGQQTFELHRN